MAAIIATAPDATSVNSSNCLQQRPIGLLTAAVDESHLEYLIRGTQPSVLRPQSFFVSWQGVLTLAYSGFPPALVDLKGQISDAFPFLAKENPGSKWPKSSLGALKDGRRLTPQELQMLNATCWEASTNFRPDRDIIAQSLLVDELSVVLYECRSLERQLLRHTLRLGSTSTSTSTSSGSGSGSGSGGPDMQHPAPEERARVAGILAEPDDPNYWFQASRDGSRESHYTGAALGVTLVHHLACCTPQRQQQRSSQEPRAAAGTCGWGVDLPAIIAQFRQQVEAAVPGAYRWFDDSSLHVTLRGII